MRSGWKMDLALAWAFGVLALIELALGHWTPMMANLVPAMLCQELYTLKRPKR